MQTLLNETKPFNIAFTRTGKLVEDDMNAITVILWNQGVAAAFRYYSQMILNGPTEISVSWRIEALAFPGTNWADLFDLLCGATWDASAPCGWTHVEGGATSA